MLPGSGYDGDVWFGRKLGSWLMLPILIVAFLLSAVPACHFLSAALAGEAAADEEAPAAESDGRMRSAPPAQ